MPIIIDHTKSILEKKYRIREVTHALGLSESAISAYFNNRKKSVSGGITLPQIAEVAKVRHQDIDWDSVNEIIELLKKFYGITIVKENSDTKKVEEQCQLF